VRSPSPALSISSQGSSFSHHSHMDMPDGVPPELFAAAGGDMRGIAKMKVTSMATEVASQSRRTNSGIFKCPSEGSCAVLADTSPGLWIDIHPPLQPQGSFTKPQRRATVQVLIRWLSKSDRRLRAPARLQTPHAAA
jgi:hypothetical protein